MQLSTTSRGTGPRTAALVHGASMSSDIWREFADILIDDYDLTVILVDLRGHGKSSRSYSYLPDDFAQDLVETLPTGLDFFIGQSLGGLAGALAAPTLLPARYIGVDPALDVSDLNGLLMKALSPLQPRFPDRLLGLLGQPPKGAAPDTLTRFRASWAQWDPAMMAQLAASGARSKKLFRAGPPAVPSTVVKADRSIAVSRRMARALQEAGWDVRVKFGAVHDMHVQDPRGLAMLLDDLLRPTVLQVATS